MPIVYDDTTKDWLDALDLKKVLAEAAAALGRSLDVLAFDNAFSATAELHYQLRDVAGYAVACQETDPAGHWPITQIVRQLAAKPETTPAELSAALVREVQAFAQQNARPGSEPATAVSAVQLAAMKSFGQQLSEFVAAVQKDDRALKALRDARQRALSTQDGSLVDLADLLDHFITGYGPGAAEQPPALQQAKVLRGALEPGKEVIVSVSASGQRLINRAHGLWVYFPSERRASPSLISELAFAETGWYDLVQAAGVYDWTILIYLAADCGRVFDTKYGKVRLMEGLAEVMQRQLQGLEKATDSDRIAVLAQMDELDQDCRRWQVRPGQTQDTWPTEALGQVNTGDPQALIDFLTWGLQNRRAKHTLLILDGQGAWGNIGGLYAAARTDAVHASLAGAKSAVGSQLGLLFDDTAMDALDLLELEQALRLASNDTGRSIDVLGFDADLSATIEVAYQLRSVAEYLVAPEDVEAVAWPLAAIVSQLAKSPEMPPADVARFIVSVFATAGDSKHDRTLSAIHLPEIQGVVEQMSAFTATARQSPAAWPALRTARDKAAATQDRNLVDLADLLDQFLKTFDPVVANDTATSARALRESLKPGVGPVVANLAKGGKVSGHMHGLSIYYPKKLVEPVYASGLNFAQTGWPDLLRQLQGEGKTIPARPHVWLYMATGDDPAQLDLLARKEQVRWGANPKTRAGDLVLMYRTAPLSDIAYLFRAASDARPAERTATWQWDYEIDLADKIALPRPVTFKELQAQPSMAGWSLVKAKMQGALRRTEDIRADGYWEALSGLLVAWNPDVAAPLAQWENLTTEKLLDEALKTAGEMPDKAERSARIANLAPFLPPTLFEVASSVVRTIAPAYRQTAALAIVNRAIELEPDKASLLTDRGEIYWRLGRYQEALVDFSRMIVIEPNNARALTGRGHTYRRLGQYEQALTDFDRAIKLNARDTWAFDGRGNTHRLIGQYEEALADFGRAIELDSTDTWALSGQGNIYRLLGRYEEALTDLNRAIEVESEDPKPWTIATRGETYREMGRSEEALADFDRAVALDASDSWAIGGRGKTYGEMGHYDEALADLNRAIELGPNNASLIASRGEIYGQMGRPTEMAADFDRALSVVKQEPDPMARAMTLASIARGLIEASQEIKAQEILSNATQIAETIRYPAALARAKAMLAEIGGKKLLPWLERLSSQASAAFGWAEKWCQTTHAGAVYTEYLLSGLYEQPDGPARRLLTLYEEDAAVRPALAQLANMMSRTSLRLEEVQVAPDQKLAGLPLSKNLSLALDQAARIADQAGEIEISSLRLLAGLQAATQSLAAEWVAERLQIDSEVLVRLLAEAPDNELPIEAIRKASRRQQAGAESNPWARIEILQGDLLTQKVDAIVHSTSQELGFGGVIGRQLRQKLGEDFVEHVRGLGTPTLDKALVTDAGELPARHIIHTATREIGRPTTPEMVARGAGAALSATAGLEDVQTVAFASMGESSGITPAESAPLILEAVADYLKQHNRPATVLFVLPDPTTCNTYQATYREMAAKSRREKVEVFYDIQLDLPVEPVRVGEEFPVTISLLPAGTGQGIFHELTLSAQEATGGDLSIELDSATVQVVGNNMTSLPLDPQTMEGRVVPRAQLAARAARPGDVEVRLTLRPASQPAITLTGMVQVAGFADQIAPVIVRPRPIPQPDMVLEVSSRWAANNTSFTYQYRLRSYRSGLIAADEAEGESKELPDGWVDKIRSQLALTLERGAGAGEDVTLALASLGAQLYRAAVPPEVRNILRDVLRRWPDGQLSLLIVPDRDAWLPWGLLYDGQAFLAERFIIGQWPRELDDMRAYEFPIGHTSIAYYEGDSMPEAWTTLLQPSGAPAPQPLPGGVFDLAQIAAVRGLHIIRTGQIPGATGRADLPVRLGSGRGRARLEEEVSSARLNLRRSRPLVTLSYLSAGQPELTMLEETWGRTYTGAGCSAFVGPLWAVDPDVEATFASTFYTTLWSGASLGAALQTAQRLARASHPGSADWLAYTLLGDPMARPYRPVKGNGYAVVEPVGRRTDDPLLPGAQARFRVMLCRKPPLWRSDRVIEVTEELALKDACVHIVAPGLSVPRGSPIRLLRTQEHDYIGWFELTAPVTPIATKSLVQLYYADGEDPVHSIMFSLTLGAAAEEAP